MTLYNVYFSLHTESSGMSPSVPGLCVAVGSAGEVLAFAVERRFLSGRASIWLAAVGLEVAATVVFLVTLPRLPAPLDSLGGQPIAG